MSAKELVYTSSVKIAPMVVKGNEGAIVYLPNKFVSVRIMADTILYVWEGSVDEWNEAFKSVLNQR